jgi:hypothetical protein
MQERSKNRLYGYVWTLIAVVTVVAIIKTTDTVRHTYDTTVEIERIRVEK